MCERCRHLGLTFNESGVEEGVHRGKLGSSYTLAAAETILNRPLLSGPRQLGFDSFQGIAASLDMPPYLHIEDNGFLEARGLEWMPKTPTAREGPLGQAFSRVEVSETIISNARDYLRQNIGFASSPSTAKRPPVFLFLSLTSPHTPVMPTAGFQGRSTLGPYGDYVMQTDDAVSIHTRSDMHIRTLVHSLSHTSLLN